MRRCPACGLLRRTSSYYLRHGKPGGYCKWCNREKNKAWRHGKSLYSSRKRWLHKLKYEYGISEAEYIELRSSQHGVCAICLTSAKLSVDHCHSTGKVRGLLCRKCNSAIGFLGDNVRYLSSAIQYLFEHGAKVGQKDPAHALRTGAYEGRSSSEDGPEPLGHETSQ